MCRRCFRNAAQLVAIPLWVASFLVFIATTPVSAQGLFDQMRSDVRSPSSYESDDTDSQKERKRRHRHCDDDDESILGAMIGSILSGMFAGNRNEKQGEAERPLVIHRPGYFPQYPYEAGHVGYMMIDPHLPAYPYTWGSRIRAEYAESFEDTSHIGGQFLFERTSGWGIDLEVYRRQEDRPGSFEDQLWMGDINVHYRFTESERLQSRFGIGMNWLSDEAGRDEGINFTWIGDWYPVDPFVISGEADIGRLGTATFFHGRITAGVEYRGLEIYTGYDYLDVGNTQIDGLVAGIRYWF